jgi:acetyl-CoA acetyltransferase
MTLDRFPRGKTAIVAASTFGMGETPGYSSMDLATAASLKALTQAGLKPADVDGLFIGLPDDFLSGLGFAEYLGIQPRITDNNRTGGSAFLTHVMWAALAIEAGQCDVALIAYGSNQRSATGKLVSSMKQAPWDAPYKLVRPAGAYALATSRYMHEYGLRREQLGEVALAARQWAQRNPDAFLRDPLTMDE